MARHIGQRGELARRLSAHLLRLRGAAQVGADPATREGFGAGAQTPSWLYGVARPGPGRRRAREGAGRRTARHTLNSLKIL